MTNPELNYQRQAILNSSPTELILKLYDFTIQACYKKEEMKVVEVLSTLKKSLNFEYEISNSLFELYDYCQRQAKQQEFDEVRELIEPVRAAWHEGIVKKKERIPRLSSNGFVV